MLASFKKINLYIIYLFILLTVEKLDFAYVIDRFHEIQYFIYLDCVTWTKVLNIQHTHFKVENNQK